MNEKLVSCSRGVNEEMQTYANHISNIASLAAVLRMAIAVTTNITIGLSLHSASNNADEQLTDLLILPLAADTTNACLA